MDKINHMLQRVTDWSWLQDTVRADFSHTLENIWYDRKKIDLVMWEFFLKIKDMLYDTRPVKEIELAVNQILNDQWVIQHFRQAQEDRVSTIDQQIGHMIPVWKKWVDYGTWHWEIAKLGLDKYQWNILSLDVIDYRLKYTKDVPFKLFDWYNIPWKEVFDYWILTNVAHHEKDNEKIIEELSHRVLETLIVIETVPSLDQWSFSKEIFLKHLPQANNKISKQMLNYYLKDIEVDTSVSDIDSEKNIKDAWLRNHANDRRWNRVVTDPRIQVPVPWTYEHRLWWVVRFGNHNWVPTEITDYWYDMRWLKDKHIWYKFKRFDPKSDLVLPEFKTNYKRQNEIYWNRI